jgi:hypothetical protein
MTPNPQKLLSSKELAELLGRHVSYVYSMRRGGFRMIAGRTSLASALLWLRDNPQPRGRSRTQMRTNG